MRRDRHRLPGLLRALPLAVILTVTGGWLLPRPASAAATFETRMVELVNRDRAANGLGAVQVAPTLARVAQDEPYGGCGYIVAGRSTDMGVRNYFSHTVLNCGSHGVADMLAPSGIRYLGENLAWVAGLTDPLQAAERLHNDLMAEPGHRANILNPNFTHVGIGSWHTLPRQTWSGGGTGLTDVYLTTEIFAQLPAAPTTTVPATTTTVPATSTTAVPATTTAVPTSTTVPATTTTTVPATTTSLPPTTLPTTTTVPATTTTLPVTTTTIRATTMTATTTSAPTARLGTTTTSTAGRQTTTSTPAPASVAPSTGISAGPAMTTSSTTLTEEPAPILVPRAPIAPRPSITSAPVPTISTGATTSTSSTMGQPNTAPLPASSESTTTSALERRTTTTTPGAVSTASATYAGPTVIEDRTLAGADSIVRSDQLAGGVALAVGALTLLLGRSWRPTRRRRI